MNGPRPFLAAPVSGRAQFLPEPSIILTIGGMWRGLLLGAAAALILTSALWARQGVVYLSDGTQLSGDIDEHDPNVVAIDVHGVQTTVPRDRIDRIEYPGNFEDDFNSRLSRLPPRDVAGRLDLACWAAEARQFDLARRAVADALAIDPSNPDALDLMTAINDEASYPIHSEPTPLTPHHLTVIVPPNRRDYLSLDQVNEIRQMELSRNEGFRVVFNHGVRRRYLAAVGGDPRAFYELEPTEQARRILATGDAGLSKDVVLLTDPASMIEFRRRILPLIIGGCAVSGCHDAMTAAGKFGLFTHDDSPQAQYTNFYLLQTWTPRPKSPIHLQMLDRTYPEKSLLAEYSLPRGQADHSHPRVLGLHRVFGGRGDPRYQSLIYWMGTTLQPVAGDYSGIDYRPPWLISATQPSSEP